MRYPVRRIASCVGVALVVTAGVAHVAADGWKIQLQGVKALGSSYAGRSVLTDDASAVWFNPACMTGLDGNLTLTAGAPLITYQLLFHDAGSRSVLGQPLQGEATPDGGTTAVVPSVYLVKRVNDRVRLGFGFNAPFGLGTDYGESWVGRYQATQTTLRVFNLNPSVATRVGGGLSLAVGLDVQRSSATIANMLDFGSFGAAAGLPLVPQQDDGRVKFDGTDWAVGWNAGALWKPRSGTSVGVAFRSEIDHTLRGPADFTVPADAAPLTGGGLVFADTQARVTLPMPTELSISASQQVSRNWTLLADWTWTGWDSFQALRVDFDNPAQLPVVQAAKWNNASRVAVGARARVNQRWELMTGVAYEGTPVPDATRTARLPEADHTWVSGGASYTCPGRWAFDFEVSHLITPDAAINLTDPAAGLLLGSVHWRLTVIGGSATIRF
jgi:long-chain fatty acid transport protein